MRAKPKLESTYADAVNRRLVADEADTRWFAANRERGLYAVAVTADAGFGSDVAAAVIRALRTGLAGRLALEAIRQSDQLQAKFMEAFAEGTRRKAVESNVPKQEIADITQSAVEHMLLVLRDGRLDGVPNPEAYQATTRNNVVIDYFRDQTRSRRLDQVVGDDAVAHFEDCPSRSASTDDAALARLSLDAACQRLDPPTRMLWNHLRQNELAGDHHGNSVRVLDRLFGARTWRHARAKLRAIFAGQELIRSDETDT